MDIAELGVIMLLCFFSTVTFSTFLILRPINTVPHIVVTLNHKINSTSTS